MLWVRYSKEPSQRDSKQMFKLKDKKIFTMLCTVIFVSMDLLMLLEINFNLVIQCCTMCFYSKKIEENGGKKTQFDLSNSLSPEVTNQSLYSFCRFSSTGSHTFLGSAVVECLTQDRGVGPI